MRMNVYEWDAIPGVSRRLYPLSAHRAEQFVSDGHARFVTLPSGRRAIQKRAPSRGIDQGNGAVGCGNLIPFGSPRTTGDPFHYEIPHAGDRSCFARHRRKLIHVSGRPRFNTQILPMARQSSALGA